MIPIPTTQTFLSLLDQSGLTYADAAILLGVNKETLRQVRIGRCTPSDGWVSDMIQILEDIALWESILKVQEKNGVALPHHLIVKKALYNITGNE